MIEIKSEQMDELADAFRKQHEVEWILGALRCRYAAMVQTLDDEFLKAEISDCLKYCDEWGLTSNSDRGGFCLLDLGGFPGLRSLPGLTELIAQGRVAVDDPEYVLLGLLMVAPFDFWPRAQAYTQAERKRRGMPT